MAVIKKYEVKTDDNTVVTYDLGAEAANVSMSDGTSVEDKVTSISETLDNISTSSGGTAITIDSALSSTSTNPVQNKVINEALSDKLDANFQSNGYVGINEVTQDLPVCYNNTRYSTTAIQIGTWIDGSAIMRIAGSVSVTGSSLSYAEDTQVSGINAEDNAKVILRQSYYFDGALYPSWALFYDAISGKSGSWTVYYIVEYVAK